MLLMLVVLTACSRTLGTALALKVGVMRQTPGQPCSRCAQSA
jgi:hypothetical protein